MLDTMKRFVEVNGKAVAVPIRFDLITDPVLFAKTLDNVDGVLFTGGFLTLNHYN